MRCATQTALVPVLTTLHRTFQNLLPPQATGAPRVCAPRGSTPRVNEGLDESQQSPNVRTAWRTPGLQWRLGLKLARHVPPCCPSTTSPEHAAHTDRDHRAFTPGGPSHSGMKHCAVSQRQAVPHSARLSAVPFPQLPSASAPCTREPGVGFHDRCLRLPGKSHQPRSQTVALRRSSAADVASRDGPAAGCDRVPLPQPPWRVPARLRRQAGHEEP